VFARLEDPISEKLKSVGEKTKGWKGFGYPQLRASGGFCYCGNPPIANPLDMDAAHYDLRFVKPLDEALLHEVFKKFDKLITVEDGTVVGGFGSAILEFMAAHQYTAQVVVLGIPDKIIEHGSPKQLQQEAGYDADALVQAAKSLLVKSERSFEL
jgi:1-deoxy-D-xylulose-5-phosphate synthase